MIMMLVNMIRMIEIMIMMVVEMIRMRITMK